MTTLDKNAGRNKVRARGGGGVEGTESRGGKEEN